MLFYNSKEEPHLACTVEQVTRLYGKVEIVSGLGYVCQQEDTELDV